jgi:hypothetical protein
VKAAAEKVKLSKGRRITERFRMNIQRFRFGNIA